MNEQYAGGVPLALQKKISGTSALGFFKTGEKIVKFVWKTNYPVVNMRVGESPCHAGFSQHLFQKTPSGIGRLGSDTV